MAEFLFLPLPFPPQKNHQWQNQSFLKCSSQFHLLHNTVHQKNLVPKVLNAFLTETAWTWLDKICVMRRGWASFGIIHMIDDECLHSWPYFPNMVTILLRRIKSMVDSYIHKYLDSRMHLTYRSHLETSDPSNQQSKELNPSCSCPVYSFFSSCY